MKASLSDQATAAYVNYLEDLETKTGQKVEAGTLTFLFAAIVVLIMFSI